MKNALAIAAFAVTAACTTAHNYRFASAAVVLRGMHFDLVGGSDQVLQIYRVSGIPIPDAFSGYSLYLEISPSLLREGTDLQVPSLGVRPYLWLLNAPMYRLSTNIVGSVHIQRLRETELRAAVHLHSADLPWSYSGEITFSSAILDRSASQ